MWDQVRTFVTFVWYEKWIVWILSIRKGRICDGPISAITHNLCVCVRWHLTISNYHLEHATSVYFERIRILFCHRSGLCFAVPSSHFLSPLSSVKYHEYYCSPVYKLRSIARKHFAQRGCRRRIACFGSNEFVASTQAGSVAKRHRSVYSISLHKKFHWVSLCLAYMYLYCELCSNLPINTNTLIAWILVFNCIVFFCFYKHFNQHTQHFFKFSVSVEISK